MLQHTQLLRTQSTYILLQALQLGDVLLLQVERRICSVVVVGTIIIIIIVVVVVVRCRFHAIRRYVSDKFSIMTDLRREEFERR